jgi:hypothetical protein
MPKFNAGAVSEPLEYDFSEAGVPARGVIKEPKDKAIAEYLADLQRAMSNLNKAISLPEGTDTSNPVAVMEALDRLSPDDFVKTIDEIAKAAAKLCGGQPTLIEIRALPLRVRREFFAWLQQEVVNPEAGSGGGQAVIHSLPSAAAG